MRRNEKERAHMEKIIVSGIHHRRLIDPINLLEKAFAEEWATLNECIPGRLTATINWLKGIDNKPLPTTKGEEVMAATVIQWLGSPVGQCFLDEVKARHLILKRKAGKV